MCWGWWGKSTTWSKGNGNGQRQSPGKAAGPNPIKLVTTTLHPLKRASRRWAEECGWVGDIRGRSGFPLGAMGTASWHKNWIKRNFNWTAAAKQCGHVAATCCLLYICKKYSTTRTRLQSNCDIIKLTTTDATTAATAPEKQKTRKSKLKSTSKAKAKAMAMAKATVAATPASNWHHWPRYVALQKRLEKNWTNCEQNLLHCRIRSDNL